MMSRATKRTMFVLSGPGQRPVRRDQHDEPLAVLRRRRAAGGPRRRGRRRGRPGPRRASRCTGRAASVASWARFSFDAATNCMARVICLMFLTEPIRRADVSLAGHVSATPRPRPGTTCGTTSMASSRAVRQLVGEGLLVGQLGQDVRALGLEEAVELALELADPRRRDVVELAVRRRVQDRDLLLDAERLVLRLLGDLRQLLAAGQLVAGRLVQVGRELGERGQRAVLGEVQLERRGDRLHRLGLRRGTHARDRDADVERGPLAGVEQVGLEEDLAVGDRDDVGRDVGRHVAGLRLDDRQRGDRAAAVLVVHAARRARAAGCGGRRRRPGYASRPGGRRSRRAISRYAQACLLQVVVDAQGVLDQALARHLDAVLHDLLGHRHARVRGEVLERGRDPRRRRRRRSCTPSRRTARGWRPCWRRSRASGRWPRRCRRGPCPSG